MRRDGETLMVARIGDGSRCDQWISTSLFLLHDSVISTVVDS